MSPERTSPEPENTPTNPEQNEKASFEAEAAARPPAESESPASPPQEEHGEDEDAELQQEIDQFDALIDQHLPGAGEDASRGEIIEVPVVAVREDGVLVDMGGKAEALVRLDEFKLIDGKPDVQPGQVIQVVQVGRDSEGSPRVSHREARVREAEATVREALKSQEPVRGRISATVKGGVMVDIGLAAFMPASQVDLFRIPDLNSMVGQDIEAYVIEYDPRRKRAVLSRRRLLYERRESARREMLDSLSEDQLIKGKVKSALDFGVFLDLGVIDGFIPREEVSYDRGTHPSEIVKAGDEIEVKVIKIDEETGKVTLSRKRINPDPWDTIDNKYSVGTIVTGKVIAIQNYGIFIHLEEGVTGMVHVSDLSWAPGNKKPSEFAKIGDDLTCQVLDLNKQNRRMSLGLKQITMDPWAEADKKYSRGTKVKGKVTSLTNYGAFVRLDDYIEGMVHVSDLSWEKRINHPKEVLKVGEEVECVVIKTDKKQRRISLGIKQLTESPFDQFVKEHPVGTLITGKVTRFAPFGAFVEVAPGLEGLVHISQIDEKRVELPEKALDAGEEITCKVVKVDARNQKISLSRRDALRQVERDQVKSYMKKGSDAKSGMMFGEALEQARKDAEKQDDES
ncbi:S1 RNA-binding domain-containing protein [bacterium]|nr:S1 RNA-binding domain-containing protein [bacterium]